MIMPTRPDIKISSGAIVDLYEELNKQTGLPAVKKGSKLRLQLKSTTPFYLHEDEDSPSIKSGVGVYHIGWRIETTEGASSVKISAEHACYIGVETLS